jgi:tetratricopeptide (TPR) repeat protein
MTKGSSRRRARAESASHVDAAERLLKSGKNAEALKALVEAARLAGDDADILARLGRAFLANGRVRQATDTLRRSIALGPGVGDVHQSLGFALESSGDEESAILSYREAVRCSPLLAEAHGRLADLLYQKGRRSEAAPEYETAAALDPGTPRAYFQTVMARLATDRLVEAEAEARQWVEADASNSGALQLLGLILQITGKLHEAERVFERAIQLDPTNAPAYQGLVNSRKFTEADRLVVDRILAQLQNEQPGPAGAAHVDRQKMTLHFAAGKVLDDQRHYADAITHFDAANEIRHRLLPFNREGMERRIDRLTKRYTPEFLRNASALGKADRTPILIVGLPRSGTSLLERILSSHPEVRGCGELDFWNDHGRLWAFAEPAELAKEAENLRAGYLSLLRGNAASVGRSVTRATDKMPFNFYWVGLVHLLFPNAVIVHCRRNPVDACLSIYMTQFSVLWDFSNARGDLVAYYRLYDRLMNHWRTVIPSDRLIEVDYEEVVAEPENAARSLVAFAGLEWDPACLHPEKNRQAIATASQWQARQPIYRSSVERWRHYEPWLGELRELLAPG